MASSFQKRCYDIFEAKEGRDRPREVFEFFLKSVIFLNAIAIVIESVNGLYDHYARFFISFELFTVGVFTVEYVFRLWAISAGKEFHHPLWGRLKYMATPFALIDLFAILPFYLAGFLGLPLNLVRVSQILRLFRILKMGRYFRAWETLLRVYQDKKPELKITLYTILILLMFSSSIIYFLENPYQPEAFSSIPAAMWWSIMTLTTVGYGDIVPVSSAGKFFGSIIALLGIGLFALPAGILGSGFIDQVLIKKHEDFTACPHCHRPLRKANFAQKGWFARLSERLLGKR